MRPNIWVKWHLPRHGRASHWGATVEWETEYRGVTLCLGRLELRAYLLPG